MRTPQLAARSVKVLAVPLLLARVIAGVWPGRGRARPRVLVVAAVSMLLALGLFAAPVSAVTVSITLKPGAGPPTSAVTVTGTGFGAREMVVVDFSAKQVATATTSSAGTFSATFTVPKTALPGNHPVTATGQTSGRSATANFLVRTDWPSFHFDPAHSGFNPYENVIGPSNVSGLKTAWTTTSSIAGVGSSPAVAGGVVYVGTGGGLDAFSAAGTTGCSGIPKTCKPLWTGTTGAIDYSSPVVASGVVYVASSDGKLYAFSAAGTTGCSGIPKTCKPLWTAAIAGAGTVGQSSPAVAGGVVYVAADTTVYAFSTAAGTANCSGTPKTCTPLWTAALVGSAGISSPAVAGGVVYVGSDFSLDAFSAAGTTGCSGTPPSRTCSPLWTGATGGNGWSSPAVAGGVVYFGSGDGKLYAFSAAAGTANCSGTPKTCIPLWTAATGGGISSAPAVAGGVAYVGSGDGKLYAFSAAGSSTHCSGTPKTCIPLWTAASAGGGQPSPAVANGVVYNGSNGKIYAFSAAGTTGCSGTPKTCTPLWTGTSNSNVTYASPAVANGVVYEGEWNGTLGLYAFSR